MDVQRSALVGLDLILEEEKVTIDLCLVHEPRVQPTAIEPPALGILGVSYQRHVCGDLPSRGYGMQVP